MPTFAVSFPDAPRYEATLFLITIKSSFITGDELAGGGWTAQKGAKRKHRLLGSTPGA
jgi:hypothetical protein